MLYSRREILDLVQDIAPGMQELLVSLIWFASRCNPNLIDADRYGLLQVDIRQARTIGFTGQPTELLDPKVNIEIASRLIESHGLLQYCGRAFGKQIPAILALESTLRQDTVKI